METKYTEDGKAFLTCEQEEVLWHPIIMEMKMHYHSDSIRDFTKEMTERISAIRTFQTYFVQHIIETYLGRELATEDKPDIVILCSIEGHPVTFIYKNKLIGRFASQLKGIQFKIGFKSCCEEFINGSEIIVTL